MNNDIIVLGDGISGLITAILARQAGMKVLLVRLARRSSPQTLLSLHPGCEVVFKELKVLFETTDNDVVRPDGYIVRAKGIDQFQPYSPEVSETWKGYLILQSSLLRRLETRLSDFLCPEITAKHIDVLHNNQARITGLMVDGQEHHGEHVIDASGPRQILARRKKIQKRFGSPRLIAELSMIRNPSHEASPVFSASCSYWNWQAGLGDGTLYSVSLTLNSAQSRVQDLNKTYVDVTWTHVSECAGPGYTIVGDAAFRLDPASGNGILRAAMTSAIAIKNHNTNGRITSYIDWVGHWAENDAGQLASRYASEPFNVEWAKKQTWSDQRN